MIPIVHFLYLAAALFMIGLIGVIFRRSALIVLMAIELMLNAGNLAFIAFARMHGNLQGHVFAFFVIAIAAAEAAVGLAIIVSIFRAKTGTDIDDLSLLRD